MNQAITAQDLQSWRTDFASGRINTLAMNAVTSVGVNNACRSLAAVRGGANHTYSLSLDQNGITWQRSSGRCWMFSGFNVLRDRIISRLNLEGFTFSGAYLMFYDKLEKANRYLEGILATLDEPADSREVDHLLKALRSDGGEWAMFVSLVRKYGVVPAEAQPETVSTDDSRGMAPVIYEQLRQCGRDLRAAHAAGEDLTALRARKDGMLETIYRMFCICYGEPVTAFDFKVRNKNGAFICDRGITPKQFYDKYIGIDLTEYVTLVSGKSNGAELKKYRTVDEGDVIEGQSVDYVSVSTDTLRELTLAQLRGGEPVWFGCDVGERSNRALGILDADMYDYEQVFGLPLDMSRAERFDSLQANMSHAMTFKGVDLDADGRPLTWRVENSWGPEPGKNGMFIMTDEWFERYNYEVIIHRRYVPKEILQVWDSDAVTPLRFYQSYV